ncbi:hypothetical protein A9Q99_06835 [Gammaproteobacteria bacterium 45_16_T64]|nr:hypothetical protein A9Q99_06835 [Gammaproteobacteria bacterium 45_16_T64]
MKPLNYLLIALSTIVFCSYASAEGDGDGGGVQYVPLSPAIITNYQSKNLSYVKAEITLQVSGSATAEAIDRHLPFIRHNLVMLFSRQDETSLTSPDGKIKLKEDALAAVVAALDEESEPSDIEAILFTSFIVE